MAAENTQLARRFGAGEMGPLSVLSVPRRLLVYFGRSWAASVCATIFPSRITNVSVENGAL
jgi:hypothetical protein